MPSTTTIRLSDELRQRVARAAERDGTTAHGFILEAIAEKAERAERRAEFEDIADQREVRLAATGETLAWSEVRAYLQVRAAGSAAPRPVPRKPTAR